MTESRLTPNNSLPRRDFIALSGLSLATLLSPPAAMAGPFAPSDFEKMIPADKKLSKDWTKALFEKGGPTVYSKKRNELRWIGLPIGGVCCGTMYLGGDGKLWLWDIFNQNRNGIEPRQVHFEDFGGGRDVDPQNGANYVSPAKPRSPLAQGFALKVGGVTRNLDAGGWQDIEFVGEYPLGKVSYRDSASPIAVDLIAYSPFIPLDVEDSSLPTTVFEFTLMNHSDKPRDAEIGGFLENACSLFSAHPGSGERVNSIAKTENATVLSCRFNSKYIAKAPARPDILIDNFDRETYAPWQVAGLAFGKGPVLRADVPAYQGDLGGAGKRVVNSHASAPGASVQERDSQTGRLISLPFTIERGFIGFNIGGGANVEEVGIRLIVNGKTVRRMAGRDENKMRSAAFDVREFAGKQATLEIYDDGRGAWGNVGIGNIIQTDAPKAEVPTGKEPDFGTMALALLNQNGVGNANTAPENLFTAPIVQNAEKPIGETLIGSVAQKITLAAGKSQTVTFALAWHFPNSGLRVPGAETGNHYVKRFADAPAVAAYVAENYPRLSRDTKLWHKTWCDSTLPHWFLDRTFSNTSILATSTARRFANDRFWGWEGIGCCEGTCSHVWHYAQAVGRIFPEIERHHRETVDFGAAFDVKSGEIGYRGEHTGPAVDGQCGRILGVYREHQMSADSGFLRRIWPNAKRAMEFLMRHDANQDGLLDGAQENTLDAAWYGKIAWISSLYAAALRACEQMATEAGDAEFAALCGQKFAQTKQAIDTELFNGEYFIQKPEAGREQSLGTYQTCHIDQVHGQSWAWQVNLGRVLDKEKTVTALHSLYKYNFAPDIGPFRRQNKPGRPYALAGDGGLIMATNPKELPHPFGNSADWQYGYFNECMSGFEHQAASHMIAEGLVLEGFAVTRAIHDRYHAARRNPYNEVECSDHYSRAMASYGSFISACGFTHHGPKGEIGFAPRLTPENFRAAFTSAEGWGTFAQKQSGKTLNGEIALHYGKLRLTALTLQGEFTKAVVKSNGKTLPATVKRVGGQAVIVFAPEITLMAGQILTVRLT